MAFASRHHRDYSAAYIAVCLPPTTPGISVTQLAAGMSVESVLVGAQDSMQVAVLLLASATAAALVELDGAPWHHVLLCFLQSRENRTELEQSSVEFLHVAQCQVGSTAGS